MKEKTKRKSKIQWGCLALLISAALLSPFCLCVGFYIYQVGEAVLEQRNCSGLPEAVEWTGSLDFLEAPETENIIRQENAANLVPLGRTELAHLPPQFWSDEPIKHPDHDYLLALRMYDYGFDGTHALAVCQQNGWASHLLSDYAKSIAFSPDGEFFAVDYVDTEEGSIIVYDAFLIEEVGRLPLGANLIQGFAFHPTEALIAVLFDKWEKVPKLEIWNYRSYTLIATYDLASLQYNYGAIAFNRDGSLLAIRSYAPEDVTIAWGVAPD